MRRLTAKTRIRLRLISRLAPGYASFFCALCIIGLLIKNFIGVACLFAVFVNLRYRFNQSITYHSESTKICIALSILLFLISSIPLLVFDTSVSLIACVPIALGMTWLLHQFGLKKKLESILSSIPTHKAFDLDNCTEEELIARCKERFKRDVEYKTERAIKHFILKLPHEEIDVNVEQSKKERYRFRKILK